MSDSVGQFFDALSPDYTATIERCFPRYREMLGALLEYLPLDRPARSIVELGCGTGNLSVLIAAAFPDAQLTLVDLSADSVAVCRSRLGDDPRFRYVAADMRGFSLPPGSADFVLASIAVHHLTGAEKRSLFENVRAWLTPRGVFSFADQFRGATPDLYAKHLDEWRKLTLKAGSTAADWEMWMEHQREHDHHDPLPDQFDWLRQAEFSAVDCTWRYLLWGCVQARRA